MAMDGRLTRRTLLATAAAGSLTGCSFGSWSTGVGTPQGRSNATATPAQPTDTPGDLDDGRGQEDRIVPPAIDYGELLTDFSDERFFALRDESIALDQNQAISGTYALRVENPGSNVSTIGYAPPRRLSLEGRNFSMAVKVDSPVGGRLEVRFRSPDDENRFVATRRLPPAMSDWMRIDFGFTRGSGNPDISNIGEIRIGMLGPEDQEVRYWIDDIRLTEAAGTPHAIFAFYGGLDSHYETAFPLLQERGWKAAVPVRPSGIGAEGRMTVGQLREVRDAGWDVCSFPMRGRPLPEMSADEQESVITRDQETLENRGFSDGARHFFAPFHSIDGATLDVLREHHSTGFLYGGSSAGVPPTAPYTLPTINGGDYDSSRAVVLRANLHDQVVTLGFDAIGGDGMSEENFEKQLDRIENNDYAGGLDVITPSDLVDQYL